MEESLEFGQGYDTLHHWFEQLTILSPAEREMNLNQIVGIERRDPGTIWKLGEYISSQTGAEWKHTALQNSFSTSHIFWAGDKKVRATACGSQHAYVITPSFLGNLLRYLVEAK